MSGGTADKLIGRLPETERRQLLDAVARETRGGSTVLVQHAYSRKLGDDDERRTVCRILGVAYSPTGGSALVLVVQPVDPNRRMIAIPVAHLLRIRWAHPTGTTSLADETDPAKYRAGEVIAGPPVERTRA